MAPNITEYNSNHCPCGLKGSTKIIDLEGKEHAIEDLAENPDNALDVLTVDEKGSLTTAVAKRFQISGWLDEVYIITLSNGHQISAGPDHQFLNSEGEWVVAKDLEFGLLLRTAVYNPKTRHPYLSLNEVSSVRLATLDEPEPYYEFQVDGTETLLTAQEIDGQYSLITVHATCEI